MRPLHLMVAFWGARYRDYLVDLCIPSLLAPGNLSILSAEDGHKFFFATTDEDWNEIQRLPIIKRLAQHARPVHVRIEAFSSKNYQEIIRHEQAAFRLLLEAAYSTAAFGCLLSPDVLASDGTIECLLDRVRKGAQLVLCPALRQIEAPVLSELTELGILNTGVRLSHTGGDIVIPKRIVGGLLARHIHPELFHFEEGADNQPVEPPPPFRYWRCKRGLILHTFFGTPVLIDFSCVPHDHTACLDRDHTFESTYVSTHFAGSTSIHVIRDSDECGLLSLTPYKEFYRPKIAPNWANSIHNIRHAYIAYTRNGDDWVRSKVGSSVTRWHDTNLSWRWFRWERSIRRLLEESIGDFLKDGSKRRRRVPYGQHQPLIGQWIYSLGFVGKHLYRGVKGHKDSQRWLRWALRKRVAILARRSFDEPRPQI
jgi:hypothetical protein